MAPNLMKRVKIECMYLLGSNPCAYSEITLGFKPLSSAAVSNELLKIGSRFAPIGLGHRPSNLRLERPGEGNVCDPIGLKPLRLAACHEKDSRHSLCCGPFYDALLRHVCDRE